VRAVLGEARRVTVRRRVPPPRLALSVEEAHEALGVGDDFWREHVAPELRIVRRGRRKLIAVAELERWLEANAELVLGENHNERGSR
jgi:excisionase family DNA binding protein